MEVRSCNALRIDIAGDKSLSLIDLRSILAQLFGFAAESW